jgi:hypothetical protein
LYVQLFVGTFHAKQEKEIYIVVRSEEITFLRLNFCSSLFSSHSGRTGTGCWQEVIINTTQKKDGAATKRWILQWLNPKTM